MVTQRDCMLTFGAGGGSLTHGNGVMTGQNGDVISIVIIGDYSTTGSVTIVINSTESIGGDLMGIKEGFYPKENGTPDMNVQVSPGIVRNADQALFVTPDDTTILVTAAAAGANKLAILEKPVGAITVPAVKYGDEVGMFTWSAPACDDGTHSATSFSNGYGAMCWEITNTTGDIAYLNSFIHHFLAGQNLRAGECHFHSEDAVTPRTPDLASVIAPPITTGWVFTSGTSLEIFSGKSIAIANGDRLYILLKDYYSPSYPSTRLMGKTAAGSITTSAGIAVTKCLYRYNGLTNWANTDVSNIFGGVLGLASPGVLGYPDPTAGSVAFAKIGTLGTPLDGNTTAIVEGTPGANEVELAQVTDDRVE